MAASAMGAGVAGNEGKGFGSLFAKARGAVMAGARRFGVAGTRLVVFTDIDGTLIGDDKRVPQEAQALLRRAARSGVRICPVSARSPRGIDPVWRELGMRGAFASFSGGYVVDERGKALYSCTMPLDVAIEVKRFANRELTGVVVNAFGYDTWVTDDAANPRVHAEERVVELRATECRDLATAFDARGVHKLLMMGDPADLGVAERRLRERYPYLAVARSNDDLLEVSAAGATKQHAIAVLCRHFGVRMEDAVAFGDGRNDIPMLAAVPNSYAVTNASDEVKAAAAHVCPWTNDEGAVARAVDCLLRGEPVPQERTMAPAVVPLLA